MEALGLGEAHLKETTAALALQVLAAGMDLAYGGDLRRGGFTELLFELVLRYTPPNEAGERVRVWNHLAWPVHIRESAVNLESLARELDGVAELVFVGLDGEPMTRDARRRARSRQPSSSEWRAGLTAMRRLQAAVARQSG